MKHLVILLDKLLIICLAFAIPLMAIVAIIMKTGYIIYMELDLIYLIKGFKKPYKTIYMELTKWQ